PPWRADLASLLHVSYRTPPTATAAAVFGLSALLGLGAVLLVAPLRRREEEAPALVADEELGSAPLTPLGLALARLEPPAEDEDPESTRRALELVSQELGQRGKTELRSGAKRLAWSAESPEGGAARDLASSARQALEESGDADG